MAGVTHYELLNLILDGQLASFEFGKIEFVDGRMKLGVVKFALQFSVLALQLGKMGFKRHDLDLPSFPRYRAGAGTCPRRPATEKSVPPQLWLVEQKLVGFSVATKCGISRALSFISAVHTKL